MNVAGEELELVARGAGVTAEVGLGEVDEDGTQGGEPEDGRGNRQRRCHSRTNSIVGVVTKFRLLIDRADSSKRCYRRLSPSPFYLAFRINRNRKRRRRRRGIIASLLPHFSLPLLTAIYFLGRKFLKRDRVALGTAYAPKRIF